MLRTDKKEWKHNHFDVYKKNSPGTAKRNLVPGVNGEAARQLMLKTIDVDKQAVTNLCNQSCDALWLEAAGVCNLTYKSIYNNNAPTPCRKPSDIGTAWRQCAGAENCKRLAFIFDYYGSVMYPRALKTTHQSQTTKHVMSMMNIVLDVNPGEMRGGQKTCIEQQYSYCAKTHKNNLLRGGWHKHHVRVNRQQGQGAKENKNWKRPKEVFFNTRSDQQNEGKRVVEKVNYSEDAQWNQWIELGVRQLVLSAGNIANSVPEQAHHDVALSRPLTTAPHPSIPVGMEALAKTFESNYIPSMGSWEIPNETFGASADYSIANTTLGASGEDLIPQDTFEATGDDLLQAVDWFDDEEGAQAERIGRNVTPNGADKRVTGANHKVPTGKSLISPEQQENDAKSKSTLLRRVVAGVNQRKKAVKANSKDNGTGDLSAELQQNAVTELAVNSTIEETTTGGTMTNTNNTALDTSHDQSGPKRRRKAKQSATPLVTDVPPILKGPPANKCLGCPHCDLLDMIIMVPGHIKCYIKNPAQYLWFATCAGDCKKPIRDIVEESSKESLYFCDIGLKGFYAPDDDPEKAGMECEMILCVPCHAKRQVQYALIQNDNGTANRRSSRRGINK